MTSEEIIRDLLNLLIADTKNLTKEIKELRKFVEQDDMKLGFYRRSNIRVSEDTGGD